MFKNLICLKEIFISRFFLNCISMDLLEEQVSEERDPDLN